jgi:hypothetical protein
MVHLESSALMHFAQDRAYSDQRRYLLQMLQGLGGITSSSRQYALRRHGADERGRRVHRREYRFLVHLRLE